jgi:hypothetical protein
MYRYGCTKSHHFLYIYDFLSGSYGDLVTPLVVIYLDMITKMLNDENAEAI